MEEDSTNSLFAKIDALSSLDEEETENFVETALKNVEGTLRSNQREAENMGKEGAGDVSVNEVLSPDNVEEIQVRARPFENPKVTVWLKDCPVWANAAWRTELTPNGLNAYNGRVQTSLNVRPF